MWAVSIRYSLNSHKYHVKKNEQEKDKKIPQTVDIFVVDQVTSLTCFLLRDIEDTRRRLFMESKRQLIARVVLGSPSCSRDLLNKC